MFLSCKNAFSFSIGFSLNYFKFLSPEKRNDYIEVHNYINALNHGIYKITSGELPISSRLIKEIHSILLRGVRGENKYPGEYRISQNWIGGSMPSNAKHVPPPHFMLNELMSDLEKFMHNDDLKIPHLLKIAILHYQFETIHPFSDGNGRVGRLIMFKECLRNNITPFIIDEEHKLFYYRGLKNYKEDKAYLIETCLSAQDKYIKLLNELEIKF